jgi:hypothetical protein
VQRHNNASLSICPRSCSGAEQDLTQSKTRAFPLPTPTLRFRVSTWQQDLNQSKTWTTSCNERFLQRMLLASPIFHGSSIQLLSLLVTIPELRDFTRDLDQSQSGFRSGPDLTFFLGEGLSLQAKQRSAPPKNHGPARRRPRPSAGSPSRSTACRRDPRRRRHHHLAERDSDVLSGKVETSSPPAGMAVGPNAKKDQT